MENNKPELIYVYDPLCGWCYCFSPVMQKLKENYKDKLNFTVYSGGLAIGSRAQTIKEGYSFIKGASKVAENATGVKFGKVFMELVEEGSYFYNSEPPCVAMTVFKDLKPEKAFEIAHDMQIDFFRDGKSLNDTSTYLPLAEKFGIDKETFLNKFKTDEYRKKTYQEFNKARELGANGFPTVLLKIGEDYKIISNGYKDYESVSKTIERFLK